MLKKAIFLFLFNSSVVGSKVIIWDLQNILFKTNNFKAFRKVGLPTEFLSYKSKIDNGIESTLQARTFCVLDKIPVKISQNLPIATESGKVLPLCMRAWLAGFIDGQEIIEKSKVVICDLERQNYFVNNAEKSLITNTISLMFDPNKLPYTLQPICLGARILKKCYSHGHQLYILSNWSSQGFDNFYNIARNRCIFKYFNRNNIVISGDVGIIKPDPAIFKYLINKHNLNPSECIFIDNDTLNINAARSVGIQAIIVKDRNLYKLKRDLQALGVIY